MPAAQKWQTVQERLRETLSEQSYGTWIRPIRFQGYRNGELTLSVASEFQREWVIDKYGARIRDICEQVFEDQPLTNLTFTVVEEVEPAVGLGTPAPEPVEEGTGTRFVPKFNFARFVVGPSNQFAFEAARRVAMAPGQFTNPLVIYGGVGLGKTHLLQSIGRHIQQANPLLKVVYMQCQEFVDDLVASFRTKTTDEIRRRYREIDVLLMDDIQFLSRMEQSQTEFFNIFNALHLNRKQIVLSSDRIPAEIPTLADRLRSRFENGMITAIDQPDFETRKAALLNFLRFEQKNTMDFPDEVVDFICENIKTNFRSLEGACLNVIIYAEVHKETVTVESARAAIKDLLPSYIRNVSVESIQKAVADNYNVGVMDMKGKRKTKEIAHARNVAVYLIRELTTCSQAEIGEEFGNRDHATVHHSFNVIKKKLTEDARLRAEIERIRQQLQKL